VVGNLLNMSRKLRRYIQDENTKQTKRVKEAKLKIAAAKEKVIYSKLLWCFLYMDYPCWCSVFITNLCAWYIQVKCLRQRLRNEKAKVSPCPMEECDALIDIRTQVDEAHTDMLSLKSTNQKGMLWLMDYELCIIHVILAKVLHSHRFRSKYFGVVQNFMVQSYPTCKQVVISTRFWKQNKMLVK